MTSESYHYHNFILIFTSSHNYIKCIVCFRRIDQRAAELDSTKRSDRSEIREDYAEIFEARRI